MIFEGNIGLLDKKILLKYTKHQNYGVAQTGIKPLVLMCTEVDANNEHILISISLRDSLTFCRASSKSVIS